MGTTHVEKYYYLYRMDAPLHTESSTSGVGENASLSINDTLGLLQEWLDKYAQATHEEVEIERRYKQALLDIATRRQEYADAIIETLRRSSTEQVKASPIRFSPHTPISAPVTPPTPLYDEGSTQNSHAESQPTPKQEQGYDAHSPDGASTIELVPPSQFKKRGTLKRAVLKIFAQQDTFLSTEDVVSYLKAEFPKETLDNKQVVDSIRDGRRTGQLVGHRLRIGVTNRYTYLNGLASFFSSVADSSNAKIEEVKSEYQDKFLQRMIDLEASENVKTVQNELPLNNIKPATLLAMEELK